MVCGGATQVATAMILGSPRHRPPVAKMVAAGGDAALKPKRRGRTVSSLDLSLPIAPTADPGAITGEALSNHRLAYVFPVQVADPHTTILRALAVEFAP